MPNFTKNYALTKPTANELYNVEVQNGNMEIIDTELKKASNVANEGNSRSKTNATDLEALKTFKEDPFEQTGNIVQFELYQDAPINVASHIELVQAGSGNPSPDNVRAISGHTAIKLTHCQKNLLDYDKWKTVTINGGTAVWQDNGVVLTATGDCYTYYSKFQFPCINVVPGQVVTASWEHSGDDGYAYFFPNGETAGNVTAISSKGKLSYTVPDGVSFVTFRVGVSGSGKVATYKNVQIELGSTATEFEPFKGDIITSEFGDTVYGGTFDWNTGTLTVDKAFIEFDGTENWKYYSGGFTTTINDEKASKDHASGASTHYPYIFSWTSEGVYVDGTTVAIGEKVTSHYTSLEEWKNTLATWYAGGTPFGIVYELATPIIIQLTPYAVSALAGLNTLYSSVGDTTVSGRQDIIALTHSLTERVKNLETGFTYSTEEKLTGETWVDGKPIYQKVIYGDKDTVNSDYIYIPTGIENSELGELVTFDGLYRTSNSANRLGHILNPDATGIGFAYSLTLNGGTELNVRVFAGKDASVLSAGTYYFIIKYTKTTD